MDFSFLLNIETIFGYFVPPILLGIAARIYNSIRKMIARPKTQNENFSEGYIEELHLENQDNTLERFLNHAYLAARLSEFPGILTLFFLAFLPYAGIVSLGAVIVSALSVMNSDASYFERGLVELSNLTKTMLALVISLLFFNWLIVNRMARNMTANLFWQALSLAFPTPQERKKIAAYSESIQYRNTPVSAFLRCQNSMRALERFRSGCRYGERPDRSLRHFIEEDL